MKKNINTFSIFLTVIIFVINFNIISVLAESNIIGDEEANIWESEDVFIEDSTKNTTQMPHLDLEWYHQIFSWRLFNVQGTISVLISQEDYMSWRNQFHHTYGNRNWREFNVITFINDFSMTKEDVIRSQEIFFNMNRYEIEDKINWARYGVQTTKEEMQQARVWSMQFSFNDIDALFSNDISKLWVAFPGDGVYNNGKVYSREWIMNNIETAIIDERIPLNYIIETIELSSNYEYLLEEVNRMARSAFRRGVLRLRMLELDTEEYIPEDILSDILPN